MDVTFSCDVLAQHVQRANAVLECWLSRPNFPPLDVYLDQDMYSTALKDVYDEQIQAQPEPKKVALHTGRVPSSEFGKMMTEATFLLFTSVLEGYGHYINQARANAAVIVTTNALPMNELLSPESAILVSHPSTGVNKQLLGGTFDGKHGLRGVKGMASYVKGPEICNAVERVLAMTPEERQAMGERARKQYMLDMHFFAARMNELRDLARAGTVSWYSA
uniref:Glycosyl transferase family 1 domain-containing protein n=1 Tax=Hyaloperonospora arabidopsidis (strain Emoy2) TaxID=559515 RepID=M4BZU3_HYAAE